MRTSYLLLAACAMLPAYAAAQDERSEYAGQETRSIKALSAEEVQAFLEGDGLGYAKAAELNRYPGPSHVLELADSLNLSEEQLARTQAIYDTMHAQAMKIGDAIVHSEGGLDQAFLTGAITEAGLQQRMVVLGRLEGEYRLVHLRAHLAVRALLTDDQVHRYNLLRGYHNSGQHHDD